MIRTVLLIVTFDTKEQEALFLIRCLQSRGVKVLTMDVGILAPSGKPVDVDQNQVARRGGKSLEDLIAAGDKGACLFNMIRGAEILTKELYEQGRFQGVISIGGGQGTDIGCAAMRQLPTGVPKLMVSTVASGRATFGPFVGTKDITMMHSVADLQGLNFLTRRILENAAGAICGMVLYDRTADLGSPCIPVALSMLGTTTPGALHAKAILENHGFEVVTFHQNGTGGIAMEDMIRGAEFKGVLDLNLHEIGDRYVGGLHGAIRGDRLEAAGETGIPQFIAPGSINYMVLGPLETLTPEMRDRKLIVHNSYLTLVRLSYEELRGVGKLVAEKLNRAKGLTRVFIPLQGYSFPDRRNLPHWDPEGNEAFVEALKADLKPHILLNEVEAHINDPEFIDLIVEEFLSVMEINR
ncbi:MAG: Tm-1-like ATP-binding domain-containing protein [Desulfobacterales bacterium]|nr:Tm-1-like ATP-binding domain-containing protein [Desulfobacterales bacterium]MDX2512014.1 Tm-1-like ATP-binding domain-containing protein [Desulfobacterales bacterium]